MAAVLAASAMFSAGQSPGVVSAQRTVQASQGQQDKAPLPSSGGQQVRSFALPRSAAVAYSRFGAPIWMGTAKRGNRRNRSRFNYNR